MEKYLTILTSDDSEIKGVLNSHSTSEKLIVFVHGFTGSMNEAHFYAAKAYFTEKGYDVFRFNLYTDGENTRKLRDCSVAVHSGDIQTVSEYFSEYTEIYFVGHSLAGPCISGVMNFPTNVKKVVFWDPAFDMTLTGQRCYPEGNIYLYDSSGKTIQVSLEMRDEFLKENFLEILSEQSFPKKNMYAIYADGDRHIQNKPKTDALGILGTVIDGANHGFTQEGKYEELFEKTLAFLEK